MVYVAPDHRGAGIGRLLAGRLEQAVRAEGLSRLNVWLEMLLPTAELLLPTTGWARCPRTTPA